MLNFWLEKIINKDQLKRREGEIRFINNEKSKLREGEESHHMNKQIFLGRGFFTLLLVAGKISEASYMVEAFSQIH